MKFIDEYARNCQLHDDIVKWLSLSAKKLIPRNYYKRMVDERNHKVTNGHLYMVQRYRIDEATLIPIYASRKYASDYIYRTARGVYYVIVPCFNNSTYSWKIPVDIFDFYHGDL